MNQTIRQQGQETPQTGILICKQECKIVKLHLRASWQYLAHWNMSKHHSQQVHVRYML